jgi:hypothetical protein
MVVPDTDGALVGVTLPGETVIAALINYAATVRSTMDPALMKRLDAVIVQQVEDLQQVWRKAWVKAGVIPA